MKPDGVALPVPGPVASRLARRFRPRRPWMLIVSCLLLVVLTVTLWGKWVESRDRADRLSAELKKVYVEAEKLRTEAAAAKQRMAQLERQLRNRGRTPTSTTPDRKQ
jgi:type VI protein secretion system component VasK